MTSFEPKKKIATKNGFAEKKKLLKRLDQHFFLNKMGKDLFKRILQKNI